MHQLSRTSCFACLALLFVLTSCTTNPTVPQSEKREIAPVAVSSVLDGVPYRIDIPEHWNGRLVMLLHGYEPKGMPRQQQWPQNEAAPVLLARGYAVAASAYSTQGWAVAEAIPENERLRSFFTDTYGKPARTYLVGFSLGSHMALASMEQQGQKYDGALAFCGANMPAAEVFSDGILTPLVAFDYFFPKSMPGLADPASPAMIDPSAIETALKTDEAKATLLADRLEIPRPALAGALMLNYMILREMQQRAGGHPVDNRSTRYSGFGDDDAFNKGVRRYKANTDAVRYATNNANLTGHINKPVLLFSNIADPTMPAHLGKKYSILVNESGNAKWLVTLPSVGQGHCDFTPEQITGAMDSLEKWTESGEKPALP